MVNFRRFSLFYVFLIVYCAVVSCGEVTPAPSEDVPSPSAAPDSIVNAPTSPPVVPEKIDVIDLHQLPTNSTNDAIDNAEVNVYNSTLEFPSDPSANGKMIVKLNSTVETPPFNGTGAPANSSGIQEAQDILPKIPNSSKTTCNMTQMIILEGTNSANDQPTPNGKIDTEVPDLLNSTVAKHNASEISYEPPAGVKVEEHIDKETELIEDGENTEDILRVESRLQVANNPGVPLVQGQLAAILAAVFVVVSIVAYFALLSWRRYLENRYGNRQMLINEDELNDRDDMRHFTI